MKTYFLFPVLFITMSSFAQYPSGKSIIDKVDANMTSPTRIVTAKMEINTVRGTRTLESKSTSQGTEKAYTEYLAPAREKGTKMLKLNNQLWIYSPSTDRVIQLSGHMLRQSVMGSDMSYEDMMTDRPLLEQYAAAVTSEQMVDGRKCWVVDLKAIVDDVSYYRQKMWVDEERFVPLRVEMYAKGGKLLKRITFGNVQRVQGRWYPFSFIYKDMLKDGNGTKMTIEEMQNDVTIPNNVFNLSSLK